MPTEVSRRTVRLNDLQNIPITVITYSDGSVGLAGIGGGQQSTIYFKAALSAVDEVVSGASVLTGYHIQNPNSSDVWVQFFDLLEGSVVLGTSVPALALWVPAGGALDTALASPLAFDTGISVAATSTATGSTPPTTPLVASIFFE